MNDFIPTHLGKFSEPVNANPDDVILDKIPIPHSDCPLLIRFTAPEFTSLCPVTGAPDFATIVIDYIPNVTMLESKSLKLYLTAFRNTAAFHEACTLAIGHRLEREFGPRWLRVGAFWMPRGGIPLDTYYQRDPPPKDYHIPALDFGLYRGR